MYRLNYFNNFKDFNTFLNEANQLRYTIINFVKDNNGYTVLYKE
ncbi:hypothetical protein [Clostridium botulinum]|uniref:Uncharacterized protein n=1 Tax=Clostridium botulinum TaxID=1491 RepID=A0A1L7JP70_CLOBO|nr:hypothetical protein [Clostridium botulinum]APU87285.1 hypothetical protein NPD8_4063 [Clostridium botulinum]